MIKLRLAENAEQVDPKLQDLYESSFPANERRDWNDWLTLIGKPEFSLHQIDDHEGFIGFITAWQLHDFIFFEHFSILPQKRRQNYGTEAMLKLLKQSSNSFILEVEEPDTEMAKKRIAFYERIGFHVNQYEYYQPPYNPGKNKVKLLLMSYPQKLDKYRFGEVKTQIHAIVYNSTE